MGSNSSFTSTFISETRQEYETTLRLARFLCTSLRKRGIRVGPILSDYCPYPSERSLLWEEIKSDATMPGEDVLNAFHKDWLSGLASLNLLFCLMVLAFLPPVRRLWRSLHCCCIRDSSYTIAEAMVPA